MQNHLILNVLPLVSDDFKDLFIKNRSKLSSVLLLYLLRVFMNKSLHWDREGNDCIRKLQCHCIQIMHSDIYSVFS